LRTLGHICGVLYLSYVVVFCAAIFGLATRLPPVAWNQVIVASILALLLSLIAAKLGSRRWLAVSVPCALLLLLSLFGTV